MFQPFSKILLLYKFQIILLFFSIINQINSEIVSHSPGETWQRNCSVLTGRVNETISGLVSSNSPQLILFPFPVTFFHQREGINIRLEVSTETGQLQYPLLFAIRQHEQISTIKIPYSPKEPVYFDGRKRHNVNPQTIYRNAGKTLCAISCGKFGEDVAIHISTYSAFPVDFTLTLKLSYNFMLPLNKEIKMEISPSESIFYGFTFDNPEVDLVRISATSDDKICSTFSVQPYNCPVFDDDSNVRFRGLWQTMTSRAVMTIEKVREHRAGFVVVLVAHNTDAKCSEEKDQNAKLVDAKSGRKKSLTLIVRDESKVSSEIYTLCLIIPALVGTLIVILVCNLFRWRHRWMRNQFQELLMSAEFEIPKDAIKINNNPEQDFGPVQTRNDRNHVNSQGSNPDDPLNLRYSVASFSEGVVPLTLEEEMRQEDDNAIHLNSVIRVQEKSRGKFKSDIFIGDFIRGNPGLALKNSRRFYYTILIVAVFYTIPVYQLILHYLRFLYRTGEYDICYYNYLCAHRLGVIIDFNHFYSNICYIILGGAFVWIVRRRDSNLHRTPKANVSRMNDCWLCFPKIQFDPTRGIIQHFGVYYALGIALFVEGVLSAGYHLCPNQSTFQFDTCFMYVIAVLCILKVYQFRHPMHIGANSTFGFLALFVFISLVGLILEFSESAAVGIFRRIFYVFIITIVVLYSIYYYGIGYIKDDEERPILNWRLFTRIGQLSHHPLKYSRLIFPGISLTLSLAVILVTELSEEPSFGTYLLYTLIANVIGSLVCYVGIMKPIHGEFKQGLWLQPTFYFVGALLIGGLAMSLFVQSPSAWEKSASASRAENNRECLEFLFPFYPFYDTHDAWHFLSAISLFLAFMGMLTVDDDLIFTPQSEIPVF